MFASKNNNLGNLSHELYDLRDMIVVFAVPRPRSGVEELVASSDELKYLHMHTYVVSWGREADYNDDR